MKRILFLLLIVYHAPLAVSAQELQARVTVGTAQLGTTVNKSVFNTLQTQLTDFLNNRKWTNDLFQPQERIPCIFVLTLTSADNQGNYKATMTIQAARPVYNSSYQSPLLNYQDMDVAFKYQQGQQLNFNESNVAGGDPLAANLTAIFAYYVYVILGLDYSSFSPSGGAAFFKRAQNISVSAPTGTGIKGWQSFDGIQTRYWIAENLNNVRYASINDILYTYFRKGLDNLYDNENEARKNILSALQSLQTLNKQTLGIMFITLFMQSRYTELIGIFKNAMPDMKSTVQQILSEIDIPNADKYANELK
ncbi:MAG: DUF4835 family protein [Chitinophagaceae bacterium]|jgi:hypothetical protein|nr:DUF4835 family protein [Chitinophagaceae bacterium]